MPIMVNLLPIEIVVHDFFFFFLLCTMMVHGFRLSTRSMNIEKFLFFRLVRPKVSMNLLCCAYRILIDSEEIFGFF